MSSLVYISFLVAVALCLATTSDCWPFPYHRNMLYIKALKKLAARKADLMGEGPMLSKRGLPGGDWLQGEGRRQRRRQAQKSFRNCYFSAIQCWMRRDDEGQVEAN